MKINTYLCQMQHSSKTDGQRPLTTKCLPATGTGKKGSYGQPALDELHIGMAMGCVGQNRNRRNK